MVLHKETAAGVDWKGVRAEFPVTETYAYLNSAGAGPVSRRVAETAAQFYLETEESGDRHWEVWLARREGACRHSAFGKRGARRDSLHDEHVLGHEPHHRRARRRGARRLVRA
jgi:hypothetical protein